jgi:integrase
LARYLADRRERKKPGAERLAWAHKPLILHLRTADAAALDDGACREYARQREADGVAPGTILTELSALRAATRWGADKGKLLGAAPVLELLARPEGRDRWLTRADADKLVAACKHRHVRLFVLIALHTAARRGAILALTWDRVDLANRLIDFREPGRARTKKRKVAARGTLLGVAPHVLRHIAASRAPRRTNTHGAAEGRASPADWRTGDTI